MESIEYSWSGPRAAIHPDNVSVWASRWLVRVDELLKGGANIDVPDMRPGVASKVTDPTLAGVSGFDSTK